MISRERKILHISQAHVAPGMNLTLWRETLAAHGVFLAKSGDWSAVGDRQLDAVFGAIAGIVKAHKNKGCSNEKPLPGQACGTTQTPA